MNFPELMPLKEALEGPRRLMNLTVSSQGNDHGFYDEAHFRHMLRVERMRTERSKRPFLLLLLDISRLRMKWLPEESLNGIQTALSFSLREVDIRGWYHLQSTIGILVTDVCQQDHAAVDSFIQKIYDRFCEKLAPDHIGKIGITFHVFPEADGGSFQDNAFNVHLYPDLIRQGMRKNFSLAVKKVIDVIGSSLGLLFLAPLFLMVAAAIKATSSGPVLFKQRRVGLNGKRFGMLKFRTMKTNCDSADHQNYIKKYICEQKDAAVEPGVFKLTHDSRITPIGQFLRKTSLDELPQLLNVLKGDMSLVGPRPPIPYECDLYDIWHRRRLLSCMPGITGLWQVLGRSRTTFDEMVRLDLKYIREWSLWLDIKILFMTPMAVIKGSGAL